MKLNAIEFFSMNNPVRAFIQEKIEIKNLSKLSSRSNQERVLEIGCGNGNGIKLIKKYFSPKEIYGMDLDQRMIDLAIKRIDDKSVKLKVGDVSRLPYDDNTFDAIFDFGVIHHVPNWKDVVSELYRVLKPGGEIIMEDLSIETFETVFGRVMRSILKHPYDKMYKRQELADEFKKVGFLVSKEKVFFPLQTIKYFTMLASKPTQYGHDND